MVMSQANHSATLHLPVAQCSYPEATISVHILAKAIGEVCPSSLPPLPPPSPAPHLWQCNEDAMSQESGFSEPISDIAADFEGFQKERSRFPSSLPSYPSSFPPTPLPPPRGVNWKDLPESPISPSNQFLALLSSQPELQKKWAEVERELFELQEKHRASLKQKTDMAEALSREKEVSCPHSISSRLIPFAEVQETGRRGRFLEGPGRRSQVPRLQMLLWRPRHALDQRASCLRRCCEQLR
jgi:hypothetical protein